MQRKGQRSLPLAHKSCNMSELCNILRTICLETKIVIFEAKYRFNTQNALNIIMQVYSLNVCAKLCSHKVVLQP